MQIYKNLNLGYIATKNEDTASNFKEHLLYEGEACNLIGQAVDENNRMVDLEI